MTKCALRLDQAVASGATRAMAPPTWAMKYLTFGRRQGRGLDPRIFSIAAVGEIVEIVALPVVARARREKRIESRLPAREGLAANDIGDRRCRARRSGAVAFSPSSRSPHSRWRK